MALQCMSMFVSSFLFVTGNYKTEKKKLRMEVILSHVYVIVSHVYVIVSFTINLIHVLFFNSI